jgi:hypothetical protein
MNKALFKKGKTFLFSRFVENLVPNYIAKKNLVLYTNVGCAGFRLEVPHAFLNRKDGVRLKRTQRDSNRKDGVRLKRTQRQHPDA